MYSRRFLKKKKKMNYPGWEAQTCVFHLFTTLKSGLPKKRLPLDAENVFNNPRCCSAVFVPKPLPQNTFHPTAFG